MEGNEGQGTGDQGAGSGDQGAGTQGQGAPPSGFVKRELLAQKVGEANNRFTALERKYEADMGAWKVKHEALQATHTESLQAHEWSGVLTPMGVDADTAELVKYRFNRETSQLEEGAERPSIQDWFKGHVEAKPVYLSNYLGEPPKLGSKKAPHVFGANQGVTTPPTKKDPPKSLDGVSVQDLLQLGSREAILEALKASKEQ